MIVLPYGTYAYGTSHVSNYNSSLLCYFLFFSFLFFYFHGHWASSVSNMRVWNESLSYHVRVAERHGSEG